MEYGNGQEVLQRRGKQQLIRDWRGWTEGRNAALMEEIAMEDWVNNHNYRGEINLGIPEKKEMAMTGSIPKFKR